jgi:DNA-binding NarL/FixJ family response regulator
MAEQMREIETEEADIRVLLVDDHQMFGESLRKALDEEPGITIAALADSGAAAIAAFEREKPDVVLLDYRLPDADGVELARRFKRDRPECQLVMVTAEESEEVLRRAIEAGCSGYLTKERRVNELILAIRRAQAGETMISPQLLTQLLGRLHSDHTRPGWDLTAREREVLALLAEGESNQAIARKLGISLATVRNHVQSVIAKLGAHSKLEAVAAGVRAGIVRYRTK